jgi:hypothetical protein
LNDGYRRMQWLGTYPEDKTQVRMHVHGCARAAWMRTGAHGYAWRLYRFCQLHTAQNLSLPCRSACMLPDGWIVWYNSGSDSDSGKQASAVCGVAGRHVHCLHPASSVNEDSNITFFFLVCFVLRVLVFVFDPRLRSRSVPRAYPARIA